MDNNNKPAPNSRRQRKSKSRSSSVHSIKTTSSEENPAAQITRPLPTNQNIEDPYFMALPIFEAKCEFICSLGRGSFGSVVKVQHKIDGQIYAIKIIRIKNNQIAEANQEPKRFANLNHRNIVRYHDSWIDNMAEIPRDEDSEEWTFVSENHYLRRGVVIDNKNDGLPRLWLCIQMEFCEYTLAKVIRDNLYPDLSNKLDYFWQMVEGLNYLHNEGWIHGDLTTNNVLVDHNDCVKIADFGLATTICISPNPDGKYDYSVNDDVYDLSRILNQMFNGMLLKIEAHVGCEITEANYLYRWLQQPRSKRPTCDDLLKYHDAFCNKIKRFDREFSQSV